MDWQHPQPDREPDALDRLLAEVRLAEPTPEAIGRLRGQWRLLMARRSRRRHRLLAMAAAAILTAVGLAICGHGDRATIESANSLPSTIERAAEGEGLVRLPQGPLHPQVLRHDDSVAIPIAKASPSRPPNPYELVVSAAYRRTNAARQQPVPSGSPDAVEQAEPASGDVEQPVDQPEQSAENRLEMSPQQEQWSALLARGDLQSVNVFLDRVEDPRTADAAFECLVRMTNPPLKTLLQCLHGPRAGRRLAAARVLGQLDQPAVSQELIAMVVRGVHRQEAMVGLLSSSEPTARQFVADAAQNPNLSAVLWNAERQAQTSSPRRS